MMRTLFNQFDKDNSGDISREELRAVFSEYCKGKRIPDSYLDERLAEADTDDGDGRVSFKEYVQMLTGEGDSLKGMDSLVADHNLDDLRKRFEQCKTSGKETLNREELRQFMVLAGASKDAQDAAVASEANSSGVTFSRAVQLAVPEHRVTQVNSLLSFLASNPSVIAVCFN